jgi:3-methyladenine DNA glycosylase AlkC
MTSNKGFSLKDQLFNLDKVRYFAGLFLAADPDFDAIGFEAEVMETMLDLELKKRMNLISEVLENYLPSELESAAKRIHAALPPPLDPHKTDNDFGLFVFGALGEYVARNGLDDLPVSLPLVREITKRSSMEFALRHFLNAAEVETMRALETWVHDDHYHVRRLVSEGTRPTLPWGLKTGLASTDPLPFLDVLHADKTRFVTRSVANHLNDISKKNPQLVVDTLTRWHKLGEQTPEELDWITRHALRTLVKKGNKAALALLGYHGQPDIEVSNLTVTPRVAIGETGEISFELTANSDENLMIDYVIDFVKSKGTTSPKVFKLKKLMVKSGQTLSLQKKHRFLKGATTFTHYPGEHRFTLQINGNTFGSVAFDLT